MRIAEEHESIEAVFVEMDPVQDGFSGVLIELVAAGQSYAVAETAAGIGNRLLRFRSRSQALARSLFEAELRPALARSVEEQRCTCEMGSIRMIEWTEMCLFLTNARIRDSGTSVGCRRSSPARRRQRVPPGKPPATRACFRHPRRR